ncbi:peptidase MA family metallohydrolase [Candidatus Omnitrophota bacterium]
MDYAVYAEGRDVKEKAGLLALIICLFLGGVSPGLVQAGNVLTVLESSAEAEFPFRLNFNLSAESDTNIVDVRLRYTVDRESFARIISEVYVGFIPKAVVEVGYTLEMIKTGGLPPGSSLEYWWLIKDASGNRVETAPAHIQFDDTRYAWRNLTEGMITIYWYEGNESFAGELMSATQEALHRLRETTGVYLKKPVTLYIYADASGLRGAMIYPQGWTGGVAYPRYGIMAIGVSPSDTNWGKRAIAHELTHLVIHQMTLNPYNDLPSWLSEGLAMHTEGMLSPEFATLLSQAIAQDSLISVQSLSSPFSAFAGEAVLSYAQSYSLVEYLLNNYAKSQMLELLDIFRQGSVYDAALEKVYGFDMDGLDRLWREYVTAQYQPVAEAQVRQLTTIVVW